MVADEIQNFRLAGGQRFTGHMNILIICTVTVILYSN
jgi:hypothetical protein